jgi:hypothetical protein
MAPTHIRLSDDNLLAEYVDIEQFKGVLEQRLAVGPDMAALLIRDGQIAQASHGAHISVGGWWRSIKDAIAGQHPIRLLIADLKPFQLTTSVTALTRDNVPVSCEFTIELQVNPERPANILGLAKEHGLVTKTSILTRLMPHLGERVLGAGIRQVDAVELRGNIPLQDKFQGEVMTEVERIASDIGLIARVVSVNWGFNEEEKALILKRQQEREQEILEREYQILNRGIEREAESTIFRLRTDLDVEKTKVETEDDLRRVILSNELAFLDARETGVRIQQVKQLEHELLLNRTQRLDRLKAQLEEEDHRIAMARSGGERRDVEMDLATRERQHDLAVIGIRAEMRSVERTIEEADRKQVLALSRLEEMQRLEIAARAHEDQIRTMRGLQDVEIDAESRRLDLNIRGGDAEHRRKMESARVAEESALEKIKALRDATPEQILAIQAGFSPAVANVIVEQAKAKAVGGAEQMTLMREMIQQALDAKVSSEAQARHLFDSAMQGNVGVAQGVGAGVGAGAAAAAGVTKAPPAAPAAAKAVEGTPARSEKADGAGKADANGTTECPACHRQVPFSDRFCRYCGRAMRQ